MKKVRIGLLTIGQSPRDDLVPEIRPLILPHIEIVEYGLLDNLPLGEIRRLCPEGNEMPLVTCMRDRSQVQIGETKIAGLLPQGIAYMKSHLDVRAAGVLCTHYFPKVKLPCPAVFPFPYLKYIIDEILEIEALGVVVPLEKQRRMAVEKWKKEKTVIAIKSPYTEEKTWEEIIEMFLQQRVEAVILDCIGYNIEDRLRMQREISVPVLLPRAILAHALNQLF